MVFHLSVVDMDDKNDVEDHRDGDKNTCLYCIFPLESSYLNSEYIAFDDNAQFLVLPVFSTSFYDSGTTFWSKIKWYFHKNQQIFLLVIFT